MAARVAAVLLGAVALSTTIFPVLAEDTKRLDAVEKILADQEAQIARQQKAIARLRAELLRLKAAAAVPLPSARPLSKPVAGVAAPQQSRPSIRTEPRLSAAAGAPQQSPPLAPVRAGQQAGAAIPDRPVGERPAQTTLPPEANALPEGVNVLTRPGTFVFTPSLEYTRSSSHRLVFRGVEIVPGLQLGLIDANDVSRDTAVVAGDIRFGLLERVEIEARLPFVYRSDRLTTLSQQVVSGTGPATITTTLTGRGLGDVEGAVRYQFGADRTDEPIYIATARVKAPTGLGPYSVKFDGSGIAAELATGTGFWSAGPGFLMIVPSEPAVIFVNAGYLHTFSADVDKTVGTSHIGRVSPGDSIDLSLGFGLALNPRFSVSLGYSHTMILPTEQEIGATIQRSSTLQAGSLTFGMSYQIAPGFVINNAYQFGMTSDAPNLTVVFRMPFKLG